MLKGFRSIGDTQIYWHICQKAYLNSSHRQTNQDLVEPSRRQIHQDLVEPSHRQTNQDLVEPSRRQIHQDLVEPSHRQTYQDLVEPLAELYSHILDYQARCICHLSRARLSRAWDNATNQNDWAGRITKIDEMGKNCSSLILPLRETELREQWNRQLQVLDEIRDISRILADGERQTQQYRCDEKEKDLLRDLASSYEDYCYKPLFSVGRSVGALSLGNKSMADLIGILGSKCYKPLFSVGRSVGALSLGNKSMADLIGILGSKSSVAQNRIPSQRLLLRLTTEELF